MAYRDLREFVAALESRGWLKRVTAPVSPVLEMAAIADRVVKEGGPALLFENVEGSRMPVLVNAYGSEARMALALGVSDLAEIAASLEGLLKIEIPEGGFFDKLKGLGQLSRVLKFPPKRVSRGACQEVVEASPDLSTLPVLQCWPKDGGRFVTLGQVITKDRASGKRNVGIYRLQVYGADTLGMHWHPHHDGARNFESWRDAGERMPVAVALGGDPALAYAASAPLPPGFDEYLFAGFLRNDNVDLVEAKTVDLDVPADAEIVLEGFVDPAERRVEGPFGDHTGFYTEPREFPVLRLSAVTHRKNPVYPATVTGRPPEEDYFIGNATARIFLPMLKMSLPEVVDIHFPPAGIFHNFAFVSIDKRFPLHARKVMHGCWGFGQLALTKFLVIVDKDVDVRNEQEVLWILGNHVDPARDVEIVRGPLDILDHAAPVAGAGSKMGFDATRKWPAEGARAPFPEAVAPTPEIAEKIRRRWKEYGL